MTGALVFVVTVFVYEVVVLDALVCLGGLDGFDGLYGQGTVKAVKSYQSNKGLTVDGIAGKATFSSLCK